MSLYMNWSTDPPYNPKSQGEKWKIGDCFSAGFEILCLGFIRAIGMQKIVKELEKV